MNQRLTQLRQCNVGVLLHQFDQKILVWTKLANACGATALLGFKACILLTLAARRTPEAGEISKRRAANRALDPEAINSEKRRRRSGDNGDGMA